MNVFYLTRSICLVIFLYEVSSTLVPGPEWDDPPKTFATNQELLTAEKKRSFGSIDFLSYATVPSALHTSSSLGIDLTPFIGYSSDNKPKSAYHSSINENNNLKSIYNQGYKSISDKPVSNRYISNGNYEYYKQNGNNGYKSTSSNYNHGGKPNVNNYNQNANNGYKPASSSYNQGGNPNGNNQVGSIYKPTGNSYNNQYQPNSNTGNNKKNSAYLPGSSIFNQGNNGYQPNEKINNRGPIVFKPNNNPPVQTHSPYADLINEGVNLAINSYKPNSNYNEMIMKTTYRNITKPIETKVPEPELPSTEKPVCVCSKIYDPVCSSDFKSYRNICLLECEFGTNVTVAHKGRCLDLIEEQ